MEIHLLNVQPPFDSHVADFTSRRSRCELHREQADKVLQPMKSLLDQHSIPCAVHMEVGEPAEAIVSVARRLQCDQIVMATGRKNALTRLVESSVTEKVIQRTPVPVEVIAGSEMSKWERYGIPALIGAGVAVAVVAAD
jgi:nucleotide-binding universal stress UspA family protein